MSLADPNPERASARLASLPIKVEMREPGCVLATAGRNVVTVVTAGMSAAGVTALARVCSECQRNYGRFGFVTILEAGIDLRMDPTVRAALTRVVARYSPDICAAAIVHEARGFAGTAVRSLTTGINLASRAKHPNRVFADADTGVRWVASLGDGGLAEAAALQAAIRQLRVLASEPMSFG